MEKERVLDMLREARKAKGLTQRDVAERLGITPAQYSALEIGKYEFTLDKFVDVCNLLGIELGVVEQVDSPAVLDGRIVNIRRLG